MDEQIAYHAVAENLYLSIQFLLVQILRHLPSAGWPISLSESRIMPLVIL
jgi:hypothetical protein